MLFSKRFSENAVFTGQTVTNGKRWKDASEGLLARGVNPDERGARRQKGRRKKGKRSNTELGDISIERTKPINSAIILAVAPTRNCHPFSIYIETSCHVRVSRHIYEVDRKQSAVIMESVSSAKFRARGELISD